MLEQTAYGQNQTTWKAVGDFSVDNRHKEAVILRNKDWLLRLMHYGKFSIEKFDEIRNSTESVCEHRLPFSEIPTILTNHCAEGQQ